MPATTGSTGLSHLQSAVGEGMGGQQWGSVEGKEAEGGRPREDAYTQVHCTEMSPTYNEGVKA